MNTIRIGDVEVDLPDYMSALSQRAIDHISTLKDNNERIVSCGILDNCLYLVTGVGDVRVLTPNGKLIPVSSVPLNDGMFISVEFNEKNVVLSSPLVIKSSAGCLNNSQLFVNNNYTCELELEKFTCAKK